MIDFLQWVAGVGGIGGVFAVLLFFIYRQTIKQMREDRKYTENRMSNVLDAYNKATLENTKILAELYTWLRAKNGNKT